LERVSITENLSKACERKPPHAKSNIVFLVWILKYFSVRLVQGTVQKLLNDDGGVCGVMYKAQDDVKVRKEFIILKIHLGSPSSFHFCLRWMFLEL
jgi:hypothetical protein